MEVSIPAGAQPVLPQPERTPVAVRAAVARLDSAALARFEEDWAATMTRAREEYSVFPVRQLVEHWWLWVAATMRTAVAATADGNLNTISSSVVSTRCRLAACGFAVDSQQPG